ncbi:hypothetical protein, partial [Salmonella enterica]|uniref:hypothetical protein n=1 Tax=Salmonella enterica TaxID=28901 RepID=UPI001F408049
RISGEKAAARSPQSSLLPAAPVISITSRIQQKADAYAGNIHSQRKDSSTPGENRPRRNAADIPSF